MRGSLLAQDAFELRVGYHSLQKSLSSIFTPTQEVLTEALSMVSVRTYKLYLKGCSVEKV